MYHIQYLAGLCQRRHWPEPKYRPEPTSLGWKCVVRVNNREYQTDDYYPSELLARENAALRAFNLCRNFSINDGMYPAGYHHGGLVQGVPVAIGTDRRRYGGESDSSRGSSPEQHDRMVSQMSSRHQPVYGDHRGSRYSSRRPS